MEGEARNPKKKKTYYSHFLKPLYFLSASEILVLVPTGKYSSYLSSKKLTFASDREPYRKPQLVKMQKAMDHRVIDPRTN